MIICIHTLSIEGKVFILSWYIYSVLAYLYWHDLTGLLLLSMDEESIRNICSGESWRSLI
jgi:hypothetical protein